MKLRWKILIGFFGLLLVLLIISWLTSGLKDNSVLVLDLRGPISEDRPPSIVARALEEDAVLVKDVLTAIEMARHDKKITGLMLLKPSGMGMGKTQEIRSKIDDFELSGKWAAAYLETAGEVSAGTGAYYLATACDQVFLHPQGDVGLLGLFAQVPFLRGTLDKLQIYPDYYHIGEYKNAKNLFTEKAFTESHREATEAILESVYSQMSSDIAASRGMGVEEVMALIDEGPYTAAEAHERNLVDELLFEDEFREKMKEENGGTLPLVGLKKYLKKGASGPRPRAKFALVHNSGAILRGKSDYDPILFGRVAGSDDVASALRKARKNRSIEAIIFRVNSPGGSAVASDVVRREVALAKEKKPVVVTMSDVAASGGYWMSMHADAIVAQPSTITASIGVVMGKFNSKAFWEDKLGITFDWAKRGENADLYSGLQNFTEQQQGIVWKFMERIYDDFVTNVAEGRGLTKERVDEIGRGRVWTGAQALELGLVDALGGIDVAVEIAKEKAGIDEDAAVELVTIPEPKGFLSMLLSKEDRGSAFFPKPILDPRARYSILPFDEPVLVLMPYFVYIR